MPILEVKGIIFKTQIVCCQHGYRENKLSKLSVANMDTENKLSKLSAILQNLPLMPLFIRSLMLEGNLVVGYAIHRDDLS